MADEVEEDERSLIVRSGKALHQYN